MSRQVETAGGNRAVLPYVVVVGLGLLEGNYHDHVGQSSDQDARATESVGCRRPYDGLLDRIFADACCSHPGPVAIGIDGRGANDLSTGRFPRRSQLVGPALSEGAVAMAAPDRFIAWCKQEHASIEQQLELLKGGKVRTGEDVGAGWIDTTDQSVERAKARLAELDDLLTEAGKTIVVKPDAL